jgi:hypothetical protein
VIRWRTWISLRVLLRVSFCHRPPLHSFIVLQPCWSFSSQARSDAPLVRREICRRGLMFTSCWYVQHPFRRQSIIDLLIPGTEEALVELLFLDPDGLWWLFSYMCIGGWNISEGTSNMMYWAARDNLLLWQHSGP